MLSVFNFLAAYFYSERRVFASGHVGGDLKKINPEDLLCNVFVRFKIHILAIILSVYYMFVSLFKYSPHCFIHKCGN